MTEPPQQPGSTHRVRARARLSKGGVRPEVAEALGRMEASLGDVGRYERALTEGGAEDVPPAEPTELDVPVVAPGDEPPAAPSAAPGADQPTLLPAFARGGEGAADAPGSAADADDGPVPIGGVAAAAPAAAAATGAAAAAGGAAGAPAGAAPPAGGAPPDPDLEALARRRRNGRILSWAGVVIAVAAAALWLIPQDDDDGDTPALQETTTSQLGILDPITTSSTTTTTTVPTTETTVDPASTSTTVAAPSPGGASSGGGGGRSATTTTRAPVQTTTTVAGLPAQPPGSCPISDPRGCNNPSRTVPSGPITTTTTTTAAPAPSGAAPQTGP